MIVRRLALVASLTALFTAVNFLAGIGHSFAGTGTITPVAYCAQQIVQNIETSPNVFGYCDGLTDAQVRAADRAALIIVGAA